MNKWLKKLTKKDWKELHGLIFCDDVTKVKTDKKKGYPPLFPFKNLNRKEKKKTKMYMRDLPF